MMVSPHIVQAFAPCGTADLHRRQSDGQLNRLSIAVVQNHLIRIVRRFHTSPVALSDDHDIE
jgi:hypothetical protein